jgi:phosphonate transport system substrate-binding protein
VRKILLYTLLLSLFGNCTQQKNEANEKTLPSKTGIAKSEALTETKVAKENPAESTEILKFYFTPSLDEKLVREKGQQLLDFVEKETALKFEIHIPQNYDEMIEDFGKGNADMAIMNSMSYITAQEKYDVSAKLRVVRFGKSTYFGQIIAHKDKGIKNVSDLQGKTIAFTDQLSTSGYLFPQKIMKQTGVKPAKTVFAGKHDTVVKMVYEGIVDAGATFYSEPASDGTIRDARAKLLDKYPDVADKVQIIAITEPIPNDPMVFRKDIPNEVSFKVSLALIKYMSTDEGKEVMDALYSVDGLVRCTDSDYDELRRAMNE